ncbi:MAG TPA: putative Ig domain-containing protein [Thermodesulfobacteriota bacterium]|nr:putative Ig domain-containing protein [Thermodesulfobacteriota bacterium]
MSKISFILLFVICLAYIFACSDAENMGKEDKAPETSSQTTETNKKGETQKESDVYPSNGETENHPPQVTSIKIEGISDSGIREGFRAVAEARDPDGDEVNFRYQWKLNGENIVGATDEVIQWQDDFKKGDEISVEVIPFDGRDEGVWKAEGSLKIPNSPPQIVSEPEVRMEGGKFSYAVKAEDPDGDPIEFTLKNAPEGMEIEPSTGVIMWDFDEEDIGEHNVQVIASDPEGATATQDLTLRIP